jgi:hypothetical protein
MRFPDCSCSANKHPKHKPISFWRRTIIKFYLLQPHPLHHTGFLHAALGDEKNLHQKNDVYCTHFFHMTMRLMGAVLITHTHTPYNHFLKNNFVLFFPAGAHVLCGRAH